MSQYCSILGILDQHAGSVPSGLGTTLQQRRIHQVPINIIVLGPRRRVERSAPKSQRLSLTGDGWGFLSFVNVVCSVSLFGGATFDGLRFCV